MSRSGYEDDPDDLAMWRGQVASAIRGKRGQAFLREMVEALDAMPAKQLITDALQVDGQYCALGCIGAKRGFDMTNLDPKDAYKMSDVFNIARQLVQEIEFINDECGAYDETPEHRWRRIRDWAVEHLNEGK